MNVFTHSQFRNEEIIPPHNLLGMYLLIHAGIKVKLC